MSQLFSVYDKTMNKTKVAVIGCGVIGPLHAECYKNNEDAEITWMCDLIPERAKALAEKYGVAKWTSSPAEVFAADDVDSVSICTDHDTHSELFVSALEHGKDAICEKPLAHDIKSLDAMLAAAKRFPERVCGGVFQHRFDPIYVELRELLSSGAMGTLLNASATLRCLRTEEYYKSGTWRGTWQHEGGSVLINQAIHYIDQLLWQAGPAVKITAVIRNLAHQGIIETEDSASATVEFANGAVGTIEATSGSNINWLPRLAFFGTEGGIEITNDKLSFIEMRDKALETSIREQLEAAIMPKPAAVGKKYYGTGHVAQLADFIEAVRARRAPGVTLESAAETARAILEIYKSNRVI